LLVAGQSLGQAADGAAQIAFAQVVLFEVGKGATPATIAGVLAATLLPFSLIGPFAGVMVDRWDRRRVLVGVSVARILIALLAIGVVVTGSEPAAYIGVILLLSSSRFVLAAKGAALPRTVAPDELVAANAVSSVAGMSAAFIGAVAVSTFVSAAPAAGFVVAAVCYAAAAGAFARLPAVGGGDTTEALGVGLRRVGRELAEGVRAIADHPQVRNPLVAVWLHRLLLGGGFILLVLVADEQYHFEASGYGLALAVTGVAAFAGTVVAPVLTRRHRSEALLPLSFLLAGMAALVGGADPRLGVLVAGVGVAGFAFQLLKVLVDALVGRAAPDAVRGRVFAAYDVVYNVAFVLAGLALVPLWEVGREQALLCGLAAAFFIVGLAFARWARTWPCRAQTMPSIEPKRNRRVRRCAALGAGAVPVLCFPEPGLWWLAWVALVPFLLLVRSAPARREAGIVAWWGGTGFMLGMHHWLAPNLGPFILPAGILLGALWLPWGLLTWSALADGATSARRTVFALLAVPSAWILIELARSWERLGGPWGLLGASQWNHPPTLAPVALGGVWLVSFLLVAANVATVLAITAPRTGRRAALAVVAVALVLAGPLWAGMRAGPAGRRTAEIAIVQPGVVRGPTARFARAERLTRGLKGSSVDVVLWGESSVGFDLDRRPDLRARLERLSGQVGAPLIVNVDARRAGAGGIFKTTVLVTARGLRGRYDKMRLVPFGEYVPLRTLFGWTNLVTESAAEDRRRGRHLTVLHAGDLRIGPLVCFESAFPDMSRNLANRDVDLLVFQTATSTFQDSWAPGQHAALAAVRAVEAGRTAAHVALTGMSSVFDARGRRLGALDTTATGIMHIRVPISNESTPFDRYGDWAVLVSCAILGIAAIAASARAARSTPPAPSPPSSPHGRSHWRRSGRRAGVQGLRVVASDDLRPWAPGSQTAHDGHDRDEGGCDMDNVDAAEVAVLVPTGERG
jgi:apolipoprotein N-acyltransferase